MSQKKSEMFTNLYVVRMEFKMLVGVFLINSVLTSVNSVHLTDHLAFIWLCLRAKHTQHEHMGWRWWGGKVRRRRANQGIFCQITF